MFKVNPYRPGAGLMPVYLAGRDEDIKNIENLFDGLMLNIPTQSVIFSGLRGVGKTVLINRLQTVAEEKGIFCRHIEVEERNDFISQIASCSQAFLRKISTVEKFKTKHICPPLFFYLHPAPSYQITNIFRQRFSYSLMRMTTVARSFALSNMLSTRAYSRSEWLNWPRTPMEQITGVPAR